MSIISILSEQATNLSLPDLAKPAKKRRGAKTAASTAMCLQPDAILIHSTSVDTFGDVQTPQETQKSIDVSKDINRIIYLWRMRQRWHRAEKSLILQGKALCRSHVPDADKKLASDLFDKAEKGGEIEESTLVALQPFLKSIEHFRKSRETIEKELAKLAKKLPVYEWVKSVHGIGDGGFASIVGECGDISTYKSVSAVWKRMGLAVIDGVRQRGMTNADQALIHGYNPARRSVMWNVGTNLVGGMGRGKRPAVGADLDQYDWTPYQRLFVERCRIECAANPDKMPIASVEKDGELRESYPKHAQARAKRYVEKRFLRDLYAAWKAA